MSALGASGIDVSSLNLGGNTFGWTSDGATSHPVLDASTEAGGDFVDSADAYSFCVHGNSGACPRPSPEPGRPPGVTRDCVVIAIKVSSHPQFPGCRPPAAQRGAFGCRSQVEAPRTGQSRCGVPVEIKRAIGLGSRIPAARRR
ncbi:hypothetical protein GCM10009608_35330 [Pseudonocardia alaniniphila]